MSDEEYLAHIIEEWRRAKIVFVQGAAIGGLLGFLIGVWL